MTGGNASVIVSTAINPMINGNPLDSGDEIAVFTPEGDCAGTATWSGSNMSITVWGDDSISPDKDGFALGDGIEYKVWDASAGVVSDDVDVSYSSEQAFYRTEGTYGENAIYVLSSLAATVALPEPGVPVQASPANGASDVSLSPTLSWEASSSAASYDVQVSTSSDFSSILVGETGITSTDHSLAGLSESTAYFWRVRAVNENGASAFTAKWSFTTTASDDSEPPSASANGAPVAEPDFVEIEENVEVEIAVLANDTDPDEDALEISILTHPSRGKAVVRDDRIAYRPSANYYGPDSLVYEISDGFGGTASAHLAIEVRPIANTPLFPTGDAIASPQDGANLLIGGMTPDEAVSANLGISIVWNAADVAEGGTPEYIWEMAVTKDFFEPMLRVSVGADTSLFLTYGQFSDALAGYGVDVGTTVSGYHRVVVKAGGKSRQSYARSITLTHGTVTAVDEREVPQAFSLDQNYPNPFNPQTIISYSLERAEFVTVKIYDVVGKEVATLVAQEMAAGRHDVRFNAEMLNSGTYFYRLNAGNNMATKQMVLLK